MRLRIVFVAALLVLAGCSGFGGSTAGTPTSSVDPTATSSETVTEASSGSSDTESGASPVNAYAPGVSETALENVDALLAAQDDALADTAHVTELRINVTGERDGEPFEQRTHIRERVGQDGTINYTDVRSGPNPNETRTLTVYGDGEIGIGEQSFETESENGTEFLRGVSASHLVDKAGETFFPGYIETGAYEVVNATGSGAGARITLEATEVSEAVAEDSESAVSDYRGTIVLDGDGVIRSVDIAMTVNGSGNRIEYDIDFDRSVGGDVTDTQPAWYDIARQAAPDLRVTPRATGIGLTNTGGTAVEAGQTIRLAQGADSRSVDVSTTIEPGETVFLSETTSGQLEIETTEPNQATSLSGTYQLELIDGDITVQRTNVTFE